MPLHKLTLFSFLIVFILSACGGEDASDVTTGDAQDSEIPISFVQACNLHCEYAHDQPEGCPSDLSSSLNTCLQACAQENSMTLSETCESAGVTYYQCTWNLTFTCPEGQTEPIPSNLADCADESGEWNACLLGG